MPEAKHDTGFETLEVIEKANAFNQWMYNTIQPWCKGSILEIGSGIGNISKYFIGAKAAITLSDTETVYVDKLKEKFPGTTVLSIDLENDPDPVLVGKFDTVFLLNVIEHIKSDETAILNCHRLLKPGGNLVILTPAYKFLYSKLDEGLHHYRRYTKKSLTDKIGRHNFTIKKSFYFNALGVAGWMYAKIFRLKKIPSGEMNVYNKLVGFAKLLDKLVMNRMGLSVIAIAEKKP